jgi:hypothetical protein
MTCYTSSGYYPAARALSRVKPSPRYEREMGHIFQGEDAVKTATLTGKGGQIHGRCITVMGCNDSPPFIHNSQFPIHLPPIVDTLSLTRLRDHN